MLSFNGISNFPVLPWGDENKKERKNPSNFSSDKGSKNVAFLYTTERIKIICFFSPFPICLWSGISSLTELKLKQDVV